VVDTHIFSENGRGRPKHVTSYAMDKQLRFNTVLYCTEVVFFFVITASFGLYTEDGGSGSLPDRLAPN